MSTNSLIFNYITQLTQYYWVWVMTAKLLIVSGISIEGPSK